MRIARATAVTDTGRRRLGNEDAYVCEPPLFAIADGMGGAPAGELASQITAAALEESAAHLRDEEGLAIVLKDANERILQRALVDPAATGMGTTVTVALVDEIAAAVIVGHVGDSRAYRVRDGRLEQLTHDHSLVGELVRAGRLTPQEADRHPHRAVITRALGTEAHVEVDTFTEPLQPGDIFLLCSDGLTDMVADDAILALVTQSGGDIHTAAESLVAAANAAGGDDNVTVVMLEIGEGDPTEPAPTVAAPGSGTEVTPSAATEHATPATSAPAGDGAHSIRRWGAGAGGRLPALLLIVALLVLGALAVFWGISR